MRVLEGAWAVSAGAILEFEPTLPPASAAEADTYRFRSEARVVLAQMIADAKSRPTPVKKAVRKIRGGCS